VALYAAENLYGWYKLSNVFLSRAIEEERHIDPRRRVLLQGPGRGPLLKNEFVDRVALGRLVTRALRLMPIVCFRQSTGKGDVDLAARCGCATKPGALMRRILIIRQGPPLTDISIGAAPTASKFSLKKAAP
jgi:hypothetical protein